MTGKPTTTSNRDPQVTALVLAGGESRRMGQDKALMKMDGLPLLQRVCQAASSCCHPVYVLTPRIAQYTPLLPPGCSCIEEDRPATNASPPGPLVGFGQGLAHVQTEWVLLLACDLPFLDPDVLQCWIATLPALTQDIDAFLIQHPKGWEPLCGLYRQRCQVTLNSFIANGGRSFQMWLRSQTVQPIPTPDPIFLLNCNTPQDWQVALKIYSAYPRFFGVDELTKPWPGV